MPGVMQALTWQSQPFRQKRTQMSRVVLVHGIGQHYKGEDTLLNTWCPALTDGLTRTSLQPGLVREQVAMAFYGDLFRPPGRYLAAGDPPFTSNDVEEGFEAELLMAWWEGAATTDDRVVPPTAAATTLVRAPRSVQTALRALNNSTFFSGLALRSLIFDLKQVHSYLTDSHLRQAARQRVLNQITSRTRVVVAHSLGSVVAYEALCAVPDHPVRALVTLGSPLGLRMIFDRLEPTPNPCGSWPSGTDKDFAWTNVVDQGDVVALVKDLSPLFSPQMTNIEVNNGSHAHEANRYLTDALTGQAIALGLTDA